MITKQATEQEFEQAFYFIERLWDYNVYDKEGNLLGTANAYIDNLGKGQTWKFKAYYTDIDSKDVVSYKLDTVEHYNGLN